MKRKVKFLIFLNIIFILFIHFKFFSNKILIQPFGYSLLIVASGSMEPQIKKGSIILIKKMKQYDIGDIVTFKIGKQYFITHRIIDKCENEFIMKGDNNNVQDKDLIKIDEIYGKVILKL